MDRYIFVIIYSLGLSLIGVQRTSSMGSTSGDSKNCDGNAHVSYRGMIGQKILFSVVQFLHMTIYRDVQVGNFSILLTIMAIAGVFIALKAYKDLGKFYTFEIGIREDHKLITRGIYEYIAHPGYFGQSLFLFSFVFFFWINWYITFVLCLLLFCLFKYRINFEEAMLKKKFGQSYRAYINTRWRICPFIF